MRLSEYLQAGNHIVAADVISPYAAQVDFEFYLMCKFPAVTLYDFCTNSDNMLGVTALTIKFNKYKKVWEITNLSKKLLEATQNKQEEVVAKALEKSHELLTSNLSYNNEQSLQSAIMLSYFYAYDYYTIIPEFTTGKGYADIVMIPFVPNIPALVIELKKDKVAGGAIEQIKAKDYPCRLNGYKGNTLLVGINYDSKTKEHSCLIEKA